MEQAAGAKLHQVISNDTTGTRLPLDALKRHSDVLLKELSEATMDRNDRPILATACHRERIDFVGTMVFDEHEYYLRMHAVAEIYRLSMQIYIHRIVCKFTGEPAPSQIQESVSEIFRLLSLVPDVVGPGCTLGWCLTVAGAEVGAPEQREYVLHRLAGIRSLGMNQVYSAEKVLLCLWQQQDGSPELHGRKTWQDIMKELDEGQILS